MQTWLVHMRDPARVARELGFSGFLAFQLVVGGTVLSALVHPVFIAVAAYLLATKQLFDTGGSVFAAALFWLYLGALVSGYLTSAALGLIGLKRRGLLRQGWVLLLMPLHWLLLSVAAWRRSISCCSIPSIGRRPRTGSRARRAWQALRFYADRCTGIRDSAGAPPRPLRVSASG